MAKWQEPETPLVKEQRFFPFLHREEKPLNLRESVAIEKKIRVARQLLYGSIQLFQMFVPGSTKIQTIWNFSDALVSGY